MEAQTKRMEDESREFKEELTERMDASITWIREENAAHTKESEERLGRVEKECKDNRTELRGKLARRLVSIKRDVLQTSNRLIGMTADGLRKHINQEVREVQCRMTKHEQSCDVTIEDVDKMLKENSRPIRELIQANQEKIGDMSAKINPTVSRLNRLERNEKHNKRLDAATSLKEYRIVTILAKFW